MKKRFRKIGIAARLTAVAAVILAIFLTPWLVFSVKKAQDKIWNDAAWQVMGVYDTVEQRLIYDGYVTNDLPAANTPEYEKLRKELSATMYTDQPYVLQYLDGQNRSTVMRSVLYVPYYTSEDFCYEIDISDFSTEALREFHKLLYPLSHFEEGKIVTERDAVKMDVYGRLLDREDGDMYQIFLPNRICINGKEWTVQTPVEETAELHPNESIGRWAFSSEAELEGYLEAVEQIRIRLKQATGQALTEAEEGSIGMSDRFWLESQMIDNGRVFIIAASVIDWKLRYGYYFDFYRMPLLTVFVYVLLLIGFYRRVRRMVSEPLEDTAKQAKLVSNLAFDEFKPDLKRGDEIGELNRALSEMAATLHTRWDSERDLEDKRQQFVSAASHDLKTPLALIGGYAEAIAQDISPKENARYLAAIEQETARMNGLVREMLDYTRLDRTDELKNRKTLNLTALVREVLTEYAPLFEKRRLTADIADGVRIRGDETLLRRAVGCLLENAAKYSPENGRVYVRLTNARNDLLTVENDCEPIPEDELPRLFEMFYRGDKARDRAGGHGLGLAILQKILALHYLKCTAENTKTGVRFTVRSK